jgi:short-subunit dehydrogenase
MRYALFGATSAIAEHVARLLVARGDQLFLVGRDGERLSAIVDDLTVRAGSSSARVASAVADLSDQSRHEALYDAAEAAIGPLDAILVAHGTLPDQAACERSVSETMRALDINALSAISLAARAANRFEPRRHGTIAVISSVAGDRGRGSNYVYGAAKGMVGIFLGGLRNRLAKAGVAVVTIKPGFVDTPMTAHIVKKGALWATPQAIAPAIVKAMDRGQPVVYVPGIWRWIMLVVRLIPERIFMRLSL